MAMIGCREKKISDNNDVRTVTECKCNEAAHTRARYTAK